MDKDDYEQLLFEHDFQKESITKCLEIVERYIIEHKLILVGGMSIDIALRTKGKKLYPDHKLPDYDFYSSEFHKDAYQLGEILAKDFTGVTVIRGLHASTMRVRVNFVPVADITYMPKNLFDKIPTIVSKGITIAHPYFLMIDQHRALSLPYENPPRETVLGRWKKDFQRFDMLAESFPVKKDTKINTTLVKTKVPNEVIYGNCLSGYPAMLYWLNKAIEDGFDCKDNLGSIKILKDSIECDMPNNMHFTISTDDYAKAMRKLEGSPTYINAITDKVPRRILVGKVELLDNKGRLTSAYTSDDLTVSNLQDVMCYLLTMGVMTDNKHAINAYAVCVELLYYICDKYLTTDDNVSTNSDDEIIASNIDLSGKKYLKYLPTVEVFGKFNWAESYIIAREDILVQLGVADKSFHTPKNAYFDKVKKVVPEYYAFDVHSSPVYDYDGLESKKPFEPRELP